MLRILARGTAISLPLLGLAALGCGGGDTNGTGGSGASSGTGATNASSSTTGTGGSNAVKCDGAPAELALEGTWAAYGSLAVSLQGQEGGAITICPADQVGEATLLLLMTVKADPSDPQTLSEVKATLCEVTLPVVTALVGTCDPSSKSLVSTQIIAPPSFIEALPKVANASSAGTVSGKDVGATVSLDRFTVTLGTSKTGASMPKWSVATASCNAAGLGATSACEAACVDDCAAMRDDDEDLFPGMTVQVCGYTPDDAKQNVQCHGDTPNVPGATLQGKAFIDIEVDPKCDGVAKSSCEIVGNVDTGVLYNAVGGDIYLAGAPITLTSAIKSLPTFQVDPTASKFRMVRIDGQYGAPDFKVDPAQQGAACATIIQRVNEL
jgi:hypothetical protein